MKSKYREVTPAAVILGIFQGIIMTAAFVYAGLKLGFSLGGSTIAAIMGFAVLKGLLGKGSIVENNINQTIASGINTTGAGVIFTLPVLLLMGKQFKIMPMILAAFAGSIMGIVVIIPLRKQMIDLERLRFPSGTAVAAILTSPGAGITRALLLIIGFIFSMSAVMSIKMGLIAKEVPLGIWLGLPVYTQTAIAISLMNIGAGLLTGKNGLPFALGGCLAYWIMAPTAVMTGWISQNGLPATELTEAIYMTMIRPLGIGMLIGGAIMGVIKAFPLVKAAIKTIQNAARSGFGGQEELHIQYIYLGIGVSFIILLVSILWGAKGISLPIAFLLSVIGTFWIGLAGLIVAECTGITDISPLSGLALIAVTLMLALSHNNITASVFIGLAVCVAIGQCADMMQDLKTGFLVGGKPIYQQIAQICVAWIGPLVSIGVVLLLWKGIGFGPGTDLPAPQAAALQAMIEGIVGGKAPLHHYLSGSILGGLLSTLPLGGLGVLVGLGMYLPFSITLGYGLGCVINMGIEKLTSSRFIEKYIVPLAAGFIVGEALTELIYSVIHILGSI